MRTTAGLLFSAALALAGCGGSQAASEPTTTAASEESPLPTISVEDVSASVEAHDGTMAVFDANGRDTYEEHHVPGATWIDYDNVTAESLPVDNAQRLVFYCANEQCSASHTAARQAMALGHPNVFVMSAGIQGWIAAGKRTE